MASFLYTGEEFHVKTPAGFSQHLDVDGSLGPVHILSPRSTLLALCPSQRNPVKDLMPSLEPFL